MFLGSVQPAGRLQEGAEVHGGVGIVQRAISRVEERHAARSVLAALADKPLRRADEVLSPILACN